MRYLADQVAPQGDRDKEEQASILAPIIETEQERQQKKLEHQRTEQER